MTIKKVKRAVVLFVVCLTIISFIESSVVQIAAHTTRLNVSYDICDPSSAGGGINKMWYVLEKNSESYHLGDDAQTIRYYFEQNGEDGYTWTTTVGAPSEEIKTAYANSMKKWNNVYFYCYNSDGTITKRKLINIVEGTENNHDLSIVPAILDSVATTAYVNGNGIIGEGATANSHYSNWIMWVDVTSFYENGLCNENIADFNKESAGAHEMGHILGLRDIDKNNLCKANTNEKHHFELLMGYSAMEEETEQITFASADITYKDIAGVAITRGFHTDDDHKWLKCAEKVNGKYKLICSICNGVKEVSSLSGYTYNNYGRCNSNHNLSSGNMMAVASYGTKDYYKCKYCRYVAPFANNVRQNYTLTKVNSTQHKCVNSVTGLVYTAYEDHSYYCEYKDIMSHTKTCACGHTTTEAHYIRQAEIINGRYAPCRGCYTMLDLQRDIAQISPSSIMKVTANGSYILPNGIVVLVDADIEAYENGTLVFYDKNDVPVTQ